MKEELRCILKLEKENSELVKKVKIGIKRLLNQNEQKDKEIEKLNNIIDELESYLEQQYLEWKDCETDVKFMAHEDKAILDKLKELKEGK